MSVIQELIRTESDGTISFGDYTLPAKTKKADYEFNGDLYKIKTFNEITKLEKNGMFVYESVPGTTVHNLKATAQEISFSVEGKEDSQITLELEPEQEYVVTINKNSVGAMKTNLGGKLPLSVELDSDSAVEVKIVKK